MTALNNRAWNLERFVDSFILELDRAQDTLAVKGLNRRLTYTVRDVNLDLQVFPRYDGDRVSFTTARPGEDGASRLTIQLGSITDKQIVDHANEPPARDEVKIEDIPELDEETRHSLQAVGIRSDRELERLAERNVDVGNIVQRKTGKKTDYSELANVIRRARRTASRPRVQSVELATDGPAPELRLSGENLFIHADAPPTEPRFPLAFLDSEPLPVRGASAGELRLGIAPGQLRGKTHQLSIALDTDTVVTLNIET